jgi:hypothetical protein
MACGSGDSGTNPPPGGTNPPKVTSISPTTVAPGDTLIITGSNFGATPGDNSVTFSNALSARSAIWASATALHVVVDRDATDGPVSVTTTGGTGKSPQSLTVTRGVGDFFVFAGTGPGNPLKLPNPVATKYLVIPHSVNSNAPYANNYAYSIESSSTALDEKAAAAAAKSAPLTHIEANQVFETQRWDNAAKLVQRYGTPPRNEERRPQSAAAAAPAATRQFYVLKTTQGDQDASSSYAHITATLRYTGTKCLVYADNDTLATGNFSQANYDLFGSKYDNSIEATNLNYFGPVSDVDGNGKLIMLVTPVVNRLQEPACPAGHCNCGFIAGFFNPRDLYGSPPVPVGTTNHAEIIYLLAADPTGVWDCSFPVDETASENLGTIPHEDQHLTSFSWRIFHENGTTQVTWLEEGMAHMAEFLNGDNSSNIARGKLYRADPGNISLEDNTAPLEQRGGIYLMLQLLVDRYGTGILKQILQSQCTGRSCIQNVTGQGFYDVMAEFLAAQYMSGKGITADERFNYTSINISDFGPLLVGAHSAGASTSGTIRRASGDFHTFTGLLGQDSVFQFDDPTGNLKLRAAVVRIQ